jgi:hypothetical protein
MKRWVPPFISAGSARHGVSRSPRRAEANSSTVLQAIIGTKLFIRNLISNSRAVGVLDALIRKARAHSTLRRPQIEAEASIPSDDDGSNNPMLS